MIILGSIKERRELEIEKRKMTKVFMANYRNRILEILI